MVHIYSAQFLHFSINNKIIIKYLVYFNFRSVTDFYGPRLQRRLNALDKDLEEMESIKTEMRKIENCLKALTSEHKDKKTIMALRNYNSVLKSVDDLKTKVRQFKVSISIKSFVVY